MSEHKRTCPAYGNYQPPYEECDCGAEARAPEPPQEVKKPQSPFEVGSAFSLTGNDLLQTMDGAVWAREFCRITNFQDEAWALAWFANAIMAGYDRGVVRGEKSAEGQLVAMRAERKRSDRELAAMERVQNVLRAHNINLRQRAEQTEAQLATLREALEPLVRFIDAFDAQPLQNLDDEFYGIHSGTEWEAALRLSDFKRVRAALRGQPAKGHAR